MTNAERVYSAIVNGQIATTATTAQTTYHLLGASGSVTTTAHLDSTTLDQVNGVRTVNAEISGVIALIRQVSGTAIVTASHMGILGGTRGRFKYNCEMLYTRTPDGSLRLGWDASTAPKLRRGTP